MASSTPVYTWCLLTAYMCGAIGIVCILRGPGLPYQAFQRQRSVPLEDYYQENWTLAPAEVCQSQGAYRLILMTELVIWTGHSPPDRLPQHQPLFSLERSRWFDFRYMRASIKTYGTSLLHEIHPPILVLPHSALFSYGGRFEDRDRYPQRKLARNCTLVSAEYCQCQRTNQLIPSVKQGVWTGHSPPDGVKSPLSP